jgi:hypothetical protein
VWRVYDTGMGVDWMRSHPPITLCKSIMQRYKLHLESTL